ncbi:major capsid protein [Paenibacillus dendritiformis]|uniref:major capsid protein n=1 Tax=Paenibacillus dendritiformis TaxID=130049 RepID=UPI000DA8A212|nr:major capsid protein [Paenibacillus dendritiformis]PZM64849.1 hypothetical protein DOE73_14920 [Paenibacillus dendritiformis]
MPGLAKNRLVDPILTNVAIGYKNAEYIGDQLLPIATVDKEAGKIPKWGTEAFRIYNTRRQIRSKSNRVEYDATMVSYALEEETLEAPIDDRELEEASEVLRLEMARTKMLTDNIQLKMEKDRADKVQNASNYSASHVETLSGSDKLSDPASKPLEIIGDAKATIRGSIGLYPNVMQLGATVYEKLKEHPAVIEKIKYSQKGIVTADLLAEIFDVKKVIVGKAVYADRQGELNDIWGNSMTLAYVPEGPGDIWVPAFGYTMRKKGRPQTSKYRDETIKSNVIHVADVYGVELTSKDAGFLIQSAI